MKLKLILLAVTFYSTALLAQEAGINENEPSILELKTFLTNQKVGEQNAKNESSDTPNARDLLHKLQPSVYFYDGKVKTYGENPSNLFTNVASLNSLSGSSFDKNHIKIVTIRISSRIDLNSTIDLSVFSNFKSLKYIYIVSGISATEQDIKGMIRNSSGKHTIFYKIDKGDNNQQY